VIVIEWPVTEAEKKPKDGDVPLSKDDKKFIKEHTTKKDDKKSDEGGDFNEKHPRAEAGSPAGGEFVLADSGGDAKKDEKKEKGKGKLAGTSEKVGRTGLDFKAGYDQKNGSPAVKGLQSKLNKLGLTDASGKPLAVDGKLGPKTTAAIKKAQKKLGMKPTGKADGAFLDKLMAGKSASKTKKSVEKKAGKKDAPKGPAGKLVEMNKKPAPAKTDKRPLAGSAGPGTRKGVKSA
jgi:peptidoglycan hydrolase-like protein with peptidoglycan-binding domain